MIRASERMRVTRPRVGCALVTSVLAVVLHAGTVSADPTSRFIQYRDSLGNLCTLSAHIYTDGCDGDIQGDIAMGCSAGPFAVHNLLGTIWRQNGEGPTWSGNCSMFGQCSHHFSLRRSGGPATYCVLAVNIEADGLGGHIMDHQVRACGQF
jgi:hypothetical protein